MFAQHSDIVRPRNPPAAGRREAAEAEAKAAEMRALAKISVPALRALYARCVVNSRTGLADGFARELRRRGLHV